MIYKRILIIENKPVLKDLISKTINEKNDLYAKSVDNSLSALKEIKKGIYDTIITDFDFKFDTQIPLVFKHANTGIGSDTAKFLRVMRHLDPNITVLIISGGAFNINRMRSNELKLLGTYEIIDPPIYKDAILEKLDILIKRLRDKANAEIKQDELVASNQTPEVSDKEWEDAISTEEVIEVHEAETISEDEATEIADETQEVPDSVEPGTNLDPEYFGLTMEEIKTGKFNSFKRYLRLSSQKYILIAREEHTLTPDRIKRYQEKGINRVFIHRADYENIIKENIEKAREITSHIKKVSDKEISSFIAESNSVIFKHIEHNEIDSEMLSYAKLNLESTIEVAAESEITFGLLECLSNISDFLYAHSIGVSVISSMIARILNIDSKANLMNISLAGLLHDCGKLKLDEKAYTTPHHQLSVALRRSYREHPVIGYRILSNLPNLPAIIPQAVLQHHEDNLGEGYPKHIKGDQICKPAKIISVANEFCNLTIKNPLYRQMSPVKAILQIEAIKSANYDPEIVKALKQILANKQLAGV